MAKARMTGKFCPNCMKDVDNAASVCPFCRSKLPVPFGLKEILYVFLLAIPGMIIYWYAFEGGSRSFKKVKLRVQYIFTQMMNIYAQKKAILKKLFLKKHMSLTIAKTEINLLKMSIPHDQNVLKKFLQFYPKNFQLFTTLLLIDPPTRELAWLIK